MAQLIDRAVVGRQQLGQQRHHHHPGNEVRQIRQRLDELFIPNVAHLVDEQRQDDGRGETAEQLEQADDQRVLDDGPEIGVAQEALEVPKAHPIAAQNAQVELEVLERDQHAVHRVVAENRIPDDRGQQKKIECPVLPHTGAQRHLGVVVPAFQGERFGHAVSFRFAPANPGHGARLLAMKCPSVPASGFQLIAPSIA